MRGRNDSLPRPAERRLCPCWQSRPGNAPHGDWIRFGVHWVPGSEHPEHPHVVAGEQEGSWEAAEGYRFLSHKWGDWRVVETREGEETH